MWMEGLFTAVEMFEVYLTYDASGQLLYIGMTGQGYQSRLTKHRSAKAEWVSMVDDHKTRPYPTKERAYAVEQRAIQLLKPKYNARKLTPQERRARGKNVSSPFFLSQLPASAFSDLWARMRPILEQHTEEELEELTEFFAGVLRNMKFE